MMKNATAIKEKVLAMKPTRKGPPRPKRQYHLTDDKVADELQQKEDEKMQQEDKRQKRIAAKEEMKRIKQHGDYLKRYLKDTGSKIVPDEVARAKQAKKEQDLRDIIHPAKKAKTTATTKKTSSATTKKSAATATSSTSDQQPICSE